MAKRKADMQAWLDRHNITYRPEMVKAELLQLCKQNTKPGYVADEILGRHGHKVLRLPPYHAEFNPIDLIWGNLKGRNTLAGRVHQSSPVLGHVVASLGAKISGERLQDHWSSGSGFIARKNFALNLTAVKGLIEEGFRAITPGEWARCVAHVTSVERTYWVGEEHEPVVFDLVSDSDCSCDTDTASETEGL